MKRTYLNLKDNYHLCEQLRALKDFLEREKPTFKVAMQILSKKIGKPVGLTSLQQAMEATGVVWKTTRKSPCRISVRAAVRILTEAISELYQQLSVLPPLALVHVKHEFCPAVKQESLLDPPL